MVETDGQKLTLDQLYDLMAATAQELHGVQTEENVPSDKEKPSDPERPPIDDTNTNTVQ